MEMGDEKEGWIPALGCSGMDGSRSLRQGGEGWVATGRRLVPGMADIPGQRGSCCEEERYGGQEKGVRPRGSMQRSWVTPWLLPQPCTLLTLDGHPWLLLPRG